jgi:hypothetical protein
MAAPDCEALALAHKAAIGKRKPALGGFFYLQTGFGFGLRLTI